VEEIEVDLSTPEPEGGDDEDDSSKYIFLFCFFFSIRKASVIVEHKFLVNPLTAHLFFSSCRLLVLYGDIVRTRLGLQ